MFIRLERKNDGGPGFTAELLNTDFISHFAVEEENENLPSAPRLVGITFGQTVPAVAASRYYFGPSGMTPTQVEARLQTLRVTINRGHGALWTSSDDEATVSMGLAIEY